ncbi:MAG TPA: anti-sigma factor, partial [Phenylobacterium sp.]|uniref:anti-sigma factor domain-containing protein n=1 Tax=Phenylobacterium sp. TaxID=1871053 RepID=UPI002B45C4A8
GRPPTAPAPTAAPPILNASLMSPGGGDRPMFVAAYDPARQALIVTSLMRPGDVGHVHQLWVIPADGKPHSLGMIAPGASRAMPMPKAMAPMFAPGAAIVASIEPPGGSPRATPSGPIAAMGKLERI